MPKHYFVSPSNLHRCLVCTPSAMLETHFPDSQSESAAEGTLAHKLAEIELQNFLRCNEPLREEQRKKLMRSEYWSNSMDDYVEEYVSEVIQRFFAIMEKDPATVLLLEQKLDLGKLIPGGFGYEDAVIVGSHTVEVIDLKYGRNVAVSAIDNPQLRAYALGVYWELSCIYDIDTVAMTIVQPRNGGVSSETMTAKDLLTWAEKVRPQIELALQGKGDFAAGSHCKFCRAAVRCKALADYELEIAKKQFQDASLLSDEDISEILGRAEGLVSWVNKITDYALQEAVDNGRKWPGWKLVAGWSKRKLSDEDKARKLLKAAGYTEDQFLKPQEIKGFTDLEKLMGKKKLASVLDDVIIKPPGKPKLAPESDKRPEWNAARNDFEDLDGDSPSNK